MKRQLRSIILIFILILVGLLISACGGAEPVSGSYVGKVDGSDAFIALVAQKNGEVTASVCDGASISEWFRGSADGDTLELASKSGAHLAADLAADSINGSFTPSGGSSLDFIASAVTEPAGLYRAEQTIDGVDYVGGWIVLPGGEERGSISGGGKFLSTSSGITRGWIDPEIAP